MRRWLKAPVPAALACALALAVPAAFPPDAPAQTAAGSPPAPPVPADARALGYRMSGIGLRAEPAIRLPSPRPAALPGSMRRVPLPGAGPRGDTAVLVPPERRGPHAAPPRPSGDDPRPRRVIVFVSGGPEGPGRAVEVVRGGVTPGRVDVRECVLVRIRLDAGTMRTARVALERLEVDGPKEAKAVLVRRMEERGILTLTALDGTRLSVPARLVRSLRVEPCGIEGEE